MVLNVKWTVKDIILKFLRSNSYDGLYNVNGSCACKIDDLIPCDGPIDNCKPGCLKDCDCYMKHEFHITECQKQNKEE